MNKTPKYIIDLVRKYPQIISGRKNWLKYEAKIQTTYILIKKYFKKINN